MKKRVLAVLMALCISSLNTMGAFAAAAENGTNSQAASEESIMDEESQAVSGDEEVPEEGSDEVVSEESDYSDNVGSESSDPQDSDEESANVEDEEIEPNSSSLEKETNPSSQEEEISSNDENNPSNGNMSEESSSDDDEGVQNEGNTDPGNGETDAADSEDAAPMSGECGAEGDNLTWKLTNNSEGLSLIISGNGDMSDYSEETKAPWSENTSNIKDIDLEDGVTSIGSYAFAGCSNVEEVVISENIRSVGENAFSNCTALRVIRYSGTKEAWDQINHSELPDAAEVFFGKETVIEVNAITLNETGVKLAIGEQYQLEVSIAPEDAANKDVTWSSSDDKVAMVDDVGIVTANGIGTAIITVTAANGKSAECKVEVESLYYNISYVLNGGTNAEENPDTYSKNESVKFLSPVRKGYVFAGWYADEELTQEVKGIAAGETGDKVFFAKWIGKTYKIVFNGNTANSGKMSTISYMVGKTASLPANAFVKKEYVFNGWNTKANGKGTGFKNKGSLGTFDAANGSTITLYAQWKIKDYTIVYKLNGGTNNKSNPATYNFKTAVTSLAKPTRKGYTFKGWYTDAKFKTAFKGIKKGSTGNKTVYAKWVAVKYTISYVLNGGTAPKGNPTNYYVTTATIKLKNPAKKGYTFGGWYKDAKFKTKITSITKGSTGNLKLYAKWTLTKYKITYKMNGGTNNKSNPATYTVTTKNIALAKPTKKGCVFAGWYSDSKFKNKVTVIKKGTIGNKTLYARWKIYEYTITYNLNGGKFPIGNPASYNVNTATIKLKAATKKGYYFGGWYKDAKFKTKVTSIPKGSTGNLKLYAKWENAEQNKLRRLYEYILKNGNKSGNEKYLIKSSDDGMVVKIIADPNRGLTFLYGSRSSEVNNVGGIEYSFENDAWSPFLIEYYSEQLMYTGYTNINPATFSARDDDGKQYWPTLTDCRTEDSNTKLVATMIMISNNYIIRTAFWAWEVMILENVGLSFTQLGFPMLYG